LKELFAFFAKFGNNFGIKNMTNDTKKTIIISLCCTVLTSFTIVGIVNIIHHNYGVGGFETPDRELFLKEITEQNENSAFLENLNENNQIQNEGKVSYQIYRVNSGDMIGTIAENFGVTQDTLISVNKIKQSRLLQIGQYLKIPNMPGILYTVKKSGETLESITEYFKVDLQKCALANSIKPESSLTEGQVIFVPNAELDWVTRQEINGDLFVRPLKRYYLSSPYGWRSSPFTGARSFHNGIEMAISEGTPIHPALIGVVSSTGYNSVYGNFVIISHHSGYKTLYAHMSAITCKVGQSVGLNSTIGKVGSTGQSTGPHLHFTVYKNGKTVSPFSLMK